MVRFVFRLALALGMTVEHLLANISGNELQAWRHYYSLEPFGQVRGDLQAGITASLVANMFSSQKGKPAGPGDFLLEFDKDKTANSPRKTYEAMRAAFGGMTNGGKR